MTFKFLVEVRASDRSWFVACEDDFPQRLLIF